MISDFEPIFAEDGKWNCTGRPIFEQLASWPHNLSDQLICKLLNLIILFEDGSCWQIDARNIATLRKHFAKHNISRCATSSQLLLPNQITETQIENDFGCFEIVRTRRNAMLHKTNHLTNRTTKRPAPLPCTIPQFQRSMDGFGFTGWLDRGVPLVWLVHFESLKVWHSKLKFKLPINLVNWNTKQTNWKHLTSTLHHLWSSINANLTWYNCGDSQSECTNGNEMSYWPILDD